MIILLFMLLLLAIGDCPRGRTVRAGGYYPSGGLGLILVVLIMLLLLGPAFSFVSALSAAIRFRESASQAFDTVLITLFIPMAGSIKNTVVAICVYCVAPECFRTCRPVYRNHVPTNRHLDFKALDIALYFRPRLIDLSRIFRQAQSYHR